MKFTEQDRIDLCKRITTRNHCIAYCDDMIIYDEDTSEYFLCVELVPFTSLIDVPRLHTMTAVKDKVYVAESDLRVSEKESYALLQTFKQRLAEGYYKLKEI